MSKAFWISCAVVLVAALAIWGVGTRGARADAARLRDEVDREKIEIRNEAKGKANIVNEKFIDSARELKTKLQEEKEEIKKVMRSCDLHVKTFDWGPNPPPGPDDLSRFKIWLTGRYQERDELLKKAGIVYPADPKARGDVSDWEQVTAEHVDGLLREFVVTREIYAALAASKADVSYLVVKPPKRQLEEHTETRKVDAMASLQFGEGRRGGPKKPVAQKGPYKEHSVMVRFTAHLNVVPGVMRRIEKSKKALFIVRSARIRRPGSGSRGPDLSAGKKYMRNAPDHEAPVEAELRFGFFEFPVAREG